MKNEQMVVTKAYRGAIVSPLGEEQSLLFWLSKENALKDMSESLFDDTEKIIAIAHQIEIPVSWLPILANDGMNVIQVWNFCDPRELRDLG